MSRWSDYWFPAIRLSPPYTPYIALTLACNERGALVNRPASDPYLFRLQLRQIYRVPHVSNTGGVPIMQLTRNIDDLVSALAARFQRHDRNLTPDPNQTWTLAGLADYFGVELISARSRNLNENALNRSWAYQRYLFINNLIFYKIGTETRDFRDSEPEFYDNVQEAIIDV